MTKSPLTVSRWCFPQHSPRVTALSFVFLVALTIVIAAPLYGDSGRTFYSNAPVQEVRLLAGGDVVQRHLDANATHIYKLTVAAQQFAQVTVEQKGVDLVVQVLNPDAKLNREIDSPNGLYGPEVVSILSSDTKTYTIKVYSENKLLAGDYELRVEGPHEASASDKLRDSAGQLFSEAQKLRQGASGVPETLDSAIKKYDEAIALWRELNEPRWQGYCLVNKARAYRVLAQVTLPLDRLRQDHLDQAFNNFREALSVLRQAGDVSGQAFVLNETGATHRDFGDPRDGLTSYDSALQLRIAIGDRSGQAQIYNNLGLINSLIGYQLKALEHYTQALELWRALRLSHEEMNTLVNAAKANAEMGDLDTALTQFKAVADYCDAELKKEDSLLKVSATRLKPFALTGIGLVHDTWADVNGAATNYKQALELFRKNNNAKAEADVLDNLGLLYAFLGDASQSLQYFQDALVIRQRLNQPKGWCVTLSNTGLAYTLQGKQDEALQQLKVALPLCEQARDKRFMAYTQVWMGMAYVQLQKPLMALESYQKAFAIQEDPEFADRRGQAITLDKMGQALALSRQPTQALEQYEAAIERWKAVGDKQGEALSLYGIAKIERDRSDLTKARDRIDEAIKLVETLRIRVTERQLQMLYFSGKQDLYALGIDVRMQLYAAKRSHVDKEAALSLSEQARARNLIDLLTETDRERPRGMTVENAEKNTRLQAEINELTQTLYQFRGIGAREEAARAEKTLAKKIEDQNELLAIAKENATSSQQAQTLTAREIQQLLDNDTVILEYSLGEKRSHLWSVTRTRIDHHFLPSRAEIEKAAKDLIEWLTGYEQKKRHDESELAYVSRLRQPPDRYKESARNLSRKILRHVWPQRGDKRLVIIADGILQYIPFEVLPPPNSSTNNPASLVDDKSSATLLSTSTVVYQPSASTLALLRDMRRPNHSKSVAVFADPVLETDSKGTGPTSPGYASKEKLISSLRDTGDDDFPLSKLNYSLKEADAIIAVAPQNSMKVVGLEANRALATNPILKEFDIVHFATHGIVNDKHPELSGIVLSEGYLTLRDIYRLDLPVHLVVLSACRTGLGKEVRGEGLIGLTRGFMYAGAQSVVVSLWRVDDEATAELMRHFYSAMFGKNKLPPATALRQAKLAMQAHERERWRAPYYWAGFVLQGDWK